MDRDGLGFITADELDFIEKWEPPPFLFYDPNPEATLDIKKRLCYRFGKSPLRTWFRALDTDFSSKVCWREFYQACKKHANDLSQDVALPSGAWRDLDKDLSGWISLQEWDTLGFECLFGFKRWCVHNYGTVKDALTAMDVSGDGLVSLKELRDLKLDRDIDLETLFAGLDFDGSTFWSLKRLRFIDDWDLEQEFNKDLAVRGSLLDKQFGSAKLKKRNTTAVDIRKIAKDSHGNDATTLELLMEHVGDNFRIIKAGCAEVRRFQEFCLKKFKSIPQAWAIGDPKGKMHLDELQFKHFCQKVGYTGENGDASLLWKYLGIRNPDGRISLLDVDPVSASEIAQFKCWAIKKFGEFFCQSFKQLDTDKSGCVDLEEFRSAIQKRGFEGNVDSLFALLDTDEQGTLSIDEIKRLDRWKASPILEEKGSMEKFVMVRELIYESKDDEPLRAWVAVLNKTRTMFISFDDFLRAAGPLIPKDSLEDPERICAQAWRAIDPDLKGYISLKEFDEKLFLPLQVFATWAREESGGVADFWRGVDDNGNGRVDFREMYQAVVHKISLSKQDLELIFHGLDMYGRGFLLVQDVAFLDEWDFDFTDVGTHHHHHHHHHVRHDHHHHHDHH